jgi:hypothetical protein
MSQLIRRHSPISLDSNISALESIQASHFDTYLEFCGGHEKGVPAPSVFPPSVGFCCLRDFVSSDFFVFFLLVYLQVRVIETQSDHWACMA